MCLWRHSKRGDADDASKSAMQWRTSRQMLQASMNIVKRGLHSQHSRVHAVRKTSTVRRCNGARGSSCGESSKQPPMQRTYKESQAIEQACTGLHCSVQPWVEAQAWCLLGSRPKERARSFNAPTLKVGARWYKRLKGSAFTGKALARRANETLAKSTRDQQSRESVCTHTRAGSLQTCR